MYTLQKSSENAEITIFCISLVTMNILYCVYIVNPFLLSHHINFYIAGVCYTRCCDRTSVHLCGSLPNLTVPQDFYSLVSISVEQSLIRWCGTGLELAPFLSPTDFPFSSFILWVHWIFFWSNWLLRWVLMGYGVIYDQILARLKTIVILILLHYTIYIYTWAHTSIPAPTNNQTLYIYI